MSLRDQLQHTLGSTYTLERELGGGGMSRVFLAEENALGRRVVIKVLPPEVAAEVNADRFKREIQVAARLQHPHIVPVLSAGEMGNVPYYTMPFVEGESLRARLGRSGALSISETIGVLRDVSKALAYAHERGIVHRDIKPDNVLLSGGSATVTDFGIAKAIAAARSQGDGEHLATLTQMGSSLGTPAYMAPEQAAADPATNHRADIYAFGCMAYELLAGRPPFTAMTPQRLLAAQMADTPEPITSLRPDTPTALAELVMRCLEKDADARPQHARELAHVLDNVTSGGGHHALPAAMLGGTGMLRRALLAYVAAFVFVAVLAKAAIVAIGLPDWVFPGALIVMALGLPVILFTAYVHRATRISITQTPAYTPGGTQRSSQGTMATLALKASPIVSWRRTWLGGALAVGAFVVLIAGYMLLRALGIGPFGSLIASGALQQHEKLLVADFTSSASDTSIGPVVTDAFRTALAQSTSVSMFQPNDIRDVLRRMQRPTTTRVDFNVAREIATREGIKAVVLGDVIGIGGNFAVSIRLVSPQTGEELASFRETAASDRELLPAIDRLAKDLRARIGESLRTVQAAMPLERVTTPSLEALKKYVQGNRVMSFESDFTKGSALLEEAIALDTGFAMAYRRLAVEYSNRGQPDRAMELLQKAFDHRDRLSDAERYLVTAGYYQRGPHQDIAKSTLAYETLIDLQPDFTTALNNVAINYRFQRNWAKAEEYLRRAMSLPNPPVVVFNQLAWTLVQEGRPADAWAILARQDSLFPGNDQNKERRFELLTASGQLDSAIAIARAVLASPTTQLPNRVYSSRGLAAVLSTRGQLRDATIAGQQNVNYNRQRGAPQYALTFAAWRAESQAIALNDRASAVATLERALAETPPDRLPVATRPYARLAVAYSIAGRADRVREMQSGFERSSRVMSQYTDDVDRHTIAAAQAFVERRYDVAAREFRAADQGDCTACALPYAAMSYDLAGQEDSARVIYDRYVTTPDVFRYQIDANYLAGAHKRLGELYEARGDKADALQHYRAFVDLWKNADPELQPRVAEVRARIARLSAPESR
jgi:eukaryotic-like serine/threonine-protein kinase